VVVPTLTQLTLPVLQPEVEELRLVALEGSGVLMELRVVATLVPAVVAQAGHHEKN
jgi:hypothetical protein